MTIHFDMDSVVVAARGQTWSRLSGETVILSFRDDKYYRLNGVAARIWELIQTAVTVREIAAAIGRTYEVEPKRLEVDLFEHLRQLADLNLIEIHVRER